MSIKVTKELRSDLIHLAANLNCFTNEAVGRFIRAVLTREQTKFREIKQRRK